MKNKSLAKSIKLLTNIRTEFDAVIENGKLITDNSIYKRVKDTKGIYRITKFSESFLNCLRDRKDESTK